MLRSAFIIDLVEGVTEMKRLCRAVTILGLGFGCLFLPLQASLAAAQDIVYVRTGKLIFDASKPPMDSGTMVITDGTITAVGASLPVPANARQLDLSKYTVVPGFIDSHIHIYVGPRGPTPSVGLAVLRGSKDMQYALDSGVVAARVLGTEDFIDVALKDAIEEGTIPGPHLVPAAHALSIPGGHGDFFSFPYQMPLEDFYTPFNGFINSPADAEKAVHLQLKYGARVIKILGSGGVLSPLDSFTSEQLSPEELRIIVEQAHMAHVKVAIHAENTKTILDALHAGVDSIEHGSELNQEAADFMKAHHVFLVPTVFVVDNIVMNGPKDHLPDYVIRKANELATQHFASFRFATKNGLTMAAGSDQSYEPGTGTVLDEMIAEVKYGFTPQQALVAGTKNGAELLDFDNLGTLAVGKEADFVALDGDPLSDIQVVKRTQSVVFKGKVICSPCTAQSMAQK
jgi:imidazolonepropionase-like amidohydrolase